ncbi:serine/threonine protein kinase [Lentisalinibacter sediminis]|uniref:serine/threonine protein kinase n=1 Tax=Lentisalinibacter sediminis TaxID=2992237 RepID=UPI003868D7CD
MNRKVLFATVLAGVALAGCDSGDINISPQTVDNSVDNSVSNPGGGTTNPCASYVTSGGQTLQGSYDGTNCTYSPAFADAGNNLTVDLIVPDLPNDGAHIFEGSLFVGESLESDAELAAAGIAEGGDGPVLRVEPGATLAWRTSANFLIINRGAQLFAVGREDAPITFTSESDVLGTVGPEEVQQWGGMVINGFGVTNKCSYTGTRDVDLQLDGECHVDAEGAAGLDESVYGGDNDDDSSGRLEYVVVKHTGATVGNGDELNGISFGGVGRNTVVRNLQVYSTFDDGIEMFGGSVSFENFVGVYVRDDSIDIDEGWNGSITNALVIQSETDGNHCIESDGIGSFSDLDSAVVEDFIARGLNSNFTISNLTCIVSPNGQGTATHDPGAGWRLREGLFARINDSLLIGSFADADTTSGNDNYGIRIDNRTQQAALDGDLEFNSVIMAFEEAFRGQTFPDGTTTEESFFAAEGGVSATITGATDATAAADPDLQLLERDTDGIPVFSIPYATMSVDGAVPAGAPQSGDFIGAVSLGIPDWTQNWTYGIHPDNRAQALWFE